MTKLSFKPTRRGTHSSASRKTNKSRVLTTSGLFLLALLSQANHMARAQKIVGGSDLMTSANATKVADWLGEGPVTFTKIFTKAEGDGQTATDFHAAADGKGRTITLYEVTNYSTGEPSEVVGGYNPQSWQTNNEDFNYSYSDSERTAFLFNLTTNTKYPQRKTNEPYFNVWANTNEDTGAYQTYTPSDFGPTFGGGYDLWTYSDLSIGNFYGYSYAPAGNPTSTENVLGRGQWATVNLGKIEVFTVSTGANEAPVLSVTPATNAGGRALPANAGFYLLTATDVDGDDVAIYVYDSADETFKAGPFKSGDVIKLTHTRGSAASVKPMGGGVAAHITVQGDASAQAVDSKQGESTKEVFSVKSGAKK